MISETRTRAWVKSFVWRLIGILVLGAISWLVTRSWKEVGIITVVFHFLRFVLYYFHERVWERIKWGRVRHPLSDLPVKKELAPEDKEKIKEQLKSLGYM